MRSVVLDYVTSRVPSLVQSHEVSRFLLTRVVSAEISFTVRDTRSHTGDDILYFGNVITGCGILWGVRYFACPG